MSDRHDPMAAALREAQSALARRDYRTAHARCMAVLARTPADAVALRLLALIALEHGNVTKALDVLDRAARSAPNDPDIEAQRARCLLALGSADEAASVARTAAAFGPEDAHTLDTLGVVLSRAGDHAAALGFYERAVARSPNVAGYRYNLGATLQFLGRFEDARGEYERALALEPTLYRALSSLSQLRRATPADSRVAELTALFERVTDDADAALHVGHTIAKELEDLADYPASLAWLARAKDRKRTQVRYVVDRDLALFDAATEMTARLVHRIRLSADYSQNPAVLFVVGMPRTGTTLVDRVLSSHPRVRSAGELPDFARIVKRSAGTPGAFVLDATTLRTCAGLDLDAVGARYRTVLGAHAAGADVVVDKMPLNVFYCAALLAALPEARVVCVRRHPMDTCLSNYRQLFATHNHYYNYALDLLDTARYFIGFDRLVTTLRSRLPEDRFFETSYDQLVANQEYETRRLISRCGLDWDERCLAFHLNEAPVATASAIQVRAPLYSQASGRFRRYGAALEPLAEELRRGGVDVT